LVLLPVQNIFNGEYRENCQALSFGGAFCNLSRLELPH